MIPNLNTGSSFSAEGLRQLKQEIQSLYLSDNSPWIVGYSGGKDSTAVLQLVWLAIADLPIEQRSKPIHVISTDTLVENPVVAAWVTQSHHVLKAASTQSQMPFLPHRLTPRLEDSFWVNLVGKGYPAPRHKFRWCTERLKIKPSNTFISSVVEDSGEAILILGTRKAESSTRAATMTRHEKGRVRDRLSPNASLPGCQVYTPIESWSNDEVWMFLMQVSNPWGYDNKDLLSMYSGASADGECPLVVDGSTPSCGDSRFGCWVCTLVEKDKSMTAMIQNDAEKEWMLPLLELRNQLDFRLMSGGTEEEMSDRHLRDFRRMGGNVQLFHDRPIPGPYVQEARENWLRKLLSAQTWIQENGPAEVKGLTLITIEELQEIRRIWVIEKHELEDRLPRIYKECTRSEYPGRQLDDNLVLGEEEMALLKEICGSNSLHYELTRELLSTERQQRVNTRRSQLFEKLERAIEKHYYESPEEAAELARDRAKRRQLGQAAQDVRKESK